ncbi:hypothetical protein AAHH67_07950 [Niallia circulans]
MKYKFANRIERVKPSAIRELLRLGEIQLLFHLGADIQTRKFFLLKN